MLQELIKAAANLTEILDVKNKIVIDFENKMNEMACKFPYTMLIQTEQGHSTYLMWDIQKGSKKNTFRLYIATSDEKNDEKNNIIKTALMECKLDDRLYYVPYLPEFIAEYTNYINQMADILKGSKGRNQM